MNHKEYIIPIGEEAKEFDEIFIGVIRKQSELIRCKDCKHQKTAKYHQGETVYAVSYCGLMNYYYPIGEDDDFCSKAERKDND